MKEWIKISDPYTELPKADRIWVTRKETINGKDYYDTDIVSYDMTMWDSDIGNVIAYTEFIEPEPYTPLIERAEYEKPKTENIELQIKYDDAMDLFCHAKEENIRLCSKIDKAKKQITYSMNEHLASDGTPIDEYAYCYLNVLEILEENIGE